MPVEKPQKKQTDKRVRISIENSEMPPILEKIDSKKVKLAREATESNKFTASTTPMKPSLVKDGHQEVINPFVLDNPFISHTHDGTR